MKRPSCQVLMLIVVGLAIAGFRCAAQATDFFFHDGDSPIVFLGDSITEQRMYTTLVETYVLTRNPKWNVTFRNVGWVSDTSWFSQRGGLTTGMPRDVLPLKPKAITIDFGMNDARGGDDMYAQYVASSTHLARELKAAGARVALVTPSPEEHYQPGEPGGSVYNRMLWKYALALKDIAATGGVAFVDQYTPFIQVIEAGRKAGVLGTNGPPQLVPDGIHPNWAGQLVMATAILKGLGAGALVSRAEIDAGALKVTAAERCQVELIADSKPGLTFRRTDECLPWPIPAEAQFVLKVPGFTPLEDLNRYELKVANLTGTNYLLTIDDQKAGSFSKEHLAAGVNLALQAGPITAQAQKLFEAVTNKNATFFNRWRNIQLYIKPAWLGTPENDALQQKELARLDALIADQEKQINALRQTAPHVFRLAPTE